MPLAGLWAAVAVLLRGGRQTETRQAHWSGLGCASNSGLPRGASEAVARVAPVVVNRRRLGAHTGVAEVMKLIVAFRAGFWRRGGCGPARPWEVWALFIPRDWTPRVGVLGPAMRPAEDVYCRQESLCCKGSFVLSVGWN